MIFPWSGSIVALALLVACTPTPALERSAATSVPDANSTRAAASPSAVPAAPTPAGRGSGRSPRVATIVEPRAAVGQFPRSVRDVNGLVTIAAPPRRIHTLSVGFDEITFRLVPLSRIVAVGTVTTQPEYSNVAADAQRVANRVGRNAEEIIALAPDLVVSSPFANRDLLRQLQDARVPLVIADLVSSVDAQEENIRFLAYLYGEEEEGELLVEESRARVEQLRARTGRSPREQWPRVAILSGGQSITVAGSGTTEGGVLELAGARNAAAEAGIVGNKELSLEALPSWAPDYLVVVEANPDQPTLLPRLRENPIASVLPALRENRVVIVKSSLVSTLSHWNLSGAEDLASVFHAGS